MDAIQLIQRLHQHRSWVNDNLLAAASELSEEQLHQSFAIGQGSVWRSLTHLYAAEFVWLGALEGDEQPVVPGDLPGKLPGNQLGEGGLKDLSDLKVQWNKLNQRWVVYLRSLKPEMLDGIIYKKSTSSGYGIRFGSRRSDVLLHVNTHAQYTTAQIINMLRQCGINSHPETMLISLSRQEASESETNVANAPN